MLRPFRGSAAFAVAVVLAVGLPVETAAQDFEPVDLDALRRLLAGMESEEEEGGDPRVAEPRAEPEPEAGAGQVPPGRLPREPDRPVVPWMPDPDEMSPDRPDVDRGPSWFSRFSVRLGAGYSCATARGWSSGRFTESVGVLPVDRGDHPLSANPVPGAPAWFDATPGASSCFDLAGDGTFRYRLAGRLNVGVAFRYVRTEYPMVGVGESPDLVHWDLRQPFVFDGSASDEARVVLGIVGFDFAVPGNIEITVAGGAGVAELRGEVVADVVGRFYSPGASVLYPEPAFDGGPYGAVSGPVSARVLVGELSAGFVRWLWGPVGAGAEARYLFPVESLGGPPPPVSGLDWPGEAGLSWGLAPDRWSVSAGVQLRLGPR